MTDADLSREEWIRERKLTVAQILAHDWPMSLDPGWDGCCPCCTLDGDGFTVEVHCWRTRIDGCGCKHSGIHVTGLERSQALAVATHIRDHNGWTDHTDWTIDAGMSEAEAIEEALRLWDKRERVQR